MLLTTSAVNLIHHTRLAVNVIDVRSQAPEPKNKGSVTAAAVSELGHVPVFVIESVQVFV